ncbi:MAG TPA: MerR family transcriptional regulator [Gemmatimonadaceae bacterium]|nr:MerR family transcriptional regulator [Gemmatimonadaceae bacterium]
MPTSPHLTIGALARQAGVSAQTLRHYDRLGILRPSATTRAGYRLYSEADRVRLELVRALRGLGFDLATIAKLLRGAVSARAAAELHLRALDLQVKSLTRRRAVLCVLLRDGDALTFERLQRLHVLASVDNQDRARFVGDALDARLRGTRHRALGEAIRRVAVVDLPESPTAAQVEAWLELAEMVSDESFLARHRAAGADTGTRQLGDMHALCRPAAEAVERGVQTASAEGRAIVGRWVAAMLRQQRRASRGSMKARARELRAAMEQGRDAREERFWTLLAVLNPEVARSPISIAWPWLMEGLRVLAD